MPLSTHTIAIVGATGAVGRECLQILESRGVPASQIIALASVRSAGTEIPYLGGSITVLELSREALAAADIALFCATSSVARQWAPIAIDAGVTVIDNSSAFRQDPRVPLIVPEINPPQPTQAGPSLIANPNCSTIILLLALEPLRRRFGVRSIVVSTYQAVSGAGQAGIEALSAELSAHLSPLQRGEVGESSKPGEGSSDSPRASVTSSPSPFPEPCAFNVFSHNSAVDESSGLNGEERKIIDESRKIWNQPDLEVTPTCVRVPVYRAHSESIVVRLARPATEAELRAAFANAPGVSLTDNRAANAFPTPLKATGCDDILVGRIRPDPARPPDPQGRTDSWCLFVCGDQLRKGAALNAVQIAEHLCAEPASASPRYACPL